MVVYKADDSITKQHCRIRNKNEKVKWGLNEYVANISSSIIVNNSYNMDYNVHDGWLGIPSPKETSFGMFLGWLSIQAQGAFVQEFVQSTVANLLL